ncbi:serine/threonine-protein kinase [Actinacidiphila polyblastidii]|uniref:serine/threonine-protein kinase n=1 Tax=Actinacidiphila polyblastidii TaxID=3110430 RepID=UPI0039BC6928
MPSRAVGSSGGGTSPWDSKACTGGVVHRDIKPSNAVLVGPPGEPARVKILGFGISFMVGDDTALTLTRQSIGSPPYLAPELWQGGPPSPASDLYALGAVLFELPSGEEAFQSNHVYAYAIAHAQHIPPRVDIITPDVPAWSADLVERLLAKEPADRPATAETFAIRESCSSAAQAALVPSASVPRMPSPCRDGAGRLSAGFSGRAGLRTRWVRRFRRVRAGGPRGYPRGSAGWRFDVA